MYKKFFLSCFVLIFWSEGRPPLKYISQVQSHFAAHYFHLSPLHGAVGAENNFLKNLWLYGAQSSVHKLLKTFFVVEEKEEFLATTYQPYVRFTPTTLAFLAAHAYKKTLFEQNDDQSFSKLSEITKTYSGPKNPTRIQQLIRLIDQSFKEEEKEWIPHGTTLQILLAFLYLRSETLHELQEYMARVSQEIPEALSPALVQECWQSSPQEVLLYTLAQRLENPSRPPQVNWRQMVKYKDYKPISDCCESAMRDILNLLLYDPQQQKFLLSRLKRKNQNSLLPSCKEFYTTYNDASCPSYINAAHIHEDWLHVISELSEVDYRKKGYEINPGLRNLFYCLSICLGINISKNKYLSDKRYIQRLCKKISSKRIGTLTLHNTFTKNNEFGDFYFDLVPPTRNPVHSFIVHIRPDHVWVTHLPALVDHDTYLNGDLTVTLDYLIADQLQQSDFNSPMLHDLATLYASELSKNAYPSLFKKMLLLSLATHTKHQKNLCFEYLSSYAQELNDPMIEQYKEELKSQSDTDNSL